MASFERFAPVALGLAGKTRADVSAGGAARIRTLEAVS